MPSPEELDWLQASALFDSSSPSDPSLSPPAAQPTMQFPPRSTSTTAYHPSALSRSLSNASVRTQDSSSSFWSAVLRRHEKIPPSTLLRTIPSQTQLAFTPTDLTNPRPAPKIPPHHARSASFSSTVDSISLSYSPSSSRSESPITPVSISSPFPYSPKATRRRSYDLPRHRRYLHSGSHMTTPKPTMTRTATPPPPPPVSRSPPGTKSILTRTSSVSTRASSHTNRTNSNKSVKFATLPTTVYYSNPYRGPGAHGGNYWELDPDNKSVDINIDSMDLDQDPFANYRSRVGDDDDDEEDDSEVEERKKKTKKNEKDKPSMISRLRSVTPTPDREREKQKAKRVKRLLTFARRSSASVVPNPSTTTAVHRHHYVRHRTDSSAARPTISSPYALGSHPHHHPLSDAHLYDTSTPYLNAPERPWTKPANGDGGGGHHSASYESLQSSKTTGAFSVRSVDSFGSLSLQVGVGVGRFRDWLGKAVAHGK